MTGEPTDEAVEALVEEVAKAHYEAVCPSTVPPWDKQSEAIREGWRIGARPTVAIAYLPIAAQVRAEQDTDLAYDAWVLIANSAYWDATDEANAAKWAAARDRWRDRFLAALARGSAADPEAGYACECNPIDNIQRLCNRQLEGCLFARGSADNPKAKDSQ